MRLKAVWLLLACAVISALASVSSFAQDDRTHDSAVTTVTGDSWLLHLGRTFDETSMGKTGQLGPPGPVRNHTVSDSESIGSHTSNTVALSGSDLYRLNCRGCHGEFGLGAPPEINSVINPVRASSVMAVMARMKNSGAAISRGEATKLAQQSRDALLQRLHNGGQDMPAFSYLSQMEVNALLGYLKNLAEVPGAQKQPWSVRESSLRVGELIAKSTCHTCHSATGENPSPQQLADGAIPPLSTLTTRKSRSDFIQKVTQGAPVVMGTPALMYRGRMPVFYYLREDEAAAVYDYLVSFPPGAASERTDELTTLQSNDFVPKDPSNPVIRSGTYDRTLAKTPPSDGAQMDATIVLPIAGLLVALLLAGGVALTVREMKRLAVDGAKHATIVPVTHVERSTREHVQGSLVA